MNAAGQRGDRWWSRAGRRLLARTLGELYYECLITPVQDAQGWHLDLGNGLGYRFGAEAGYWGHLRVVPDSVRRCVGGESAPADDLQQLFIDLQHLWQGDAASLCILQDELAATVAAEADLLRRRDGLDAAALADLSAPRLEALLDGHLKIPSSRGRLGWALADATAYGPEIAELFQVHWVAVARERVVTGPPPEPDAWTLFGLHLDAAERERLQAACARAGVALATHVPLPVHPWQWRHVLTRSYAALIARGELVSLGAFGVPVVAQQSLRTLCCAHRPHAPELKLSLSILNTSAWRGLGRSAAVEGAAVSEWLSQLAAGDDLLRSRLRIQRQIAGAHVAHPYASQLEAPPYRHLEQFAVVWREALPTVLDEGETALPTAALALEGADGTALIAELARRSGLDLADWLDALFEAVTVPLLHLLAAHGVGVVAHGQNVLVRLRAYRPVGLVLKDFHGDLRLVSEHWAQDTDLPEPVRAALAQLPSAFLRHDFYTGHLASVLRFVADRCAGAGLPEQAFHARLAAALQRYQVAHPQWHERLQRLDLFAPEIERVCLMRARLDIGYGDAPARPQAALGPPLDNPLHRALAVPALSDHALETSDAR